MTEPYQTMRERAIETRSELRPKMNYSIIKDMHH